MLFLAAQVEEVLIYFSVSMSRRNEKLSYILSMREIKNKEAYNHPMSVRCIIELPNFMLKIC
jgi:hypothetical protein